MTLKQKIGKQALALFLLCFTFFMLLIHSLSLSLLLSFDSQLLLKQSFLSFSYFMIFLPLFFWSVFFEWQFSLLCGNFGWILSWWKIQKKHEMIKLWGFNGKFPRIIFVVFMNNPMKNYLMGGKLSGKKRFFYSKENMTHICTQICRVYFSHTPKQDNKGHSFSLNKNCWWN